MNKVLLYLSLLFASGVAAGEGMASLDDNQLAPQYNFCEQGDSNKIDCDDQDDPARVSFPEIVERRQTLIISELVFHSPNPSPSHYSIRAPPTSY